ncbi:hypothetical protein A0H81_10707 [Grifola frondosa]|uniref:Uncharacterized protein n=1 Tax=Grifola frondosa TaxID=5627 RepID=A0A1C7LWR7_GRIFR|nr:hypothetical protein A0H81_10707 [Grifola frondosa]
MLVNLNFMFAYLVAFSAFLVLISSTHELMVLYGVGNDLRSVEAHHKRCRRLANLDCIIMKTFPKLSSNPKPSVCFYQYLP